MSAEKETGGTDNPDIPDKDKENEHEMQGEKNSNNNNEDTASDDMNQSSKSAANYSRETAQNSDIWASDSQPLLSLKISSMKMYQKDEPMIQCPECPTKFYYKSGLKHHYKTHVRQREREKKLYNCDDDDNHDNLLPFSETKEMSREKQKHKSTDVPKETGISKKSKQSINSDKTGVTKKQRKRHMKKLPKRHHGKLIQMASDMNTSEDTE